VYWCLCHIQYGVSEECVKFHFKVGKTAAETHNMFHEAHGDDAPSQMPTYEWFRHFKNGKTARDDDDDDERSGQLSRSEPLIAQVKNIIHKNH
jgi:hypothetical protein